MSVQRSLLANSVNETGSYEGKDQVFLQESIISSISEQGLP